MDSKGPISNEITPKALPEERHLRASGDPFISFFKPLSIRSKFSKYLKDRLKAFQPARSISRSAIRKICSKKTKGVALSRIRSGEPIGNPFSRSLIACTTLSSSLLFLIKVLTLLIKVRSPQTALSSSLPLIGKSGPKSGACTTLSGINLSELVHSWVESYWFIPIRFNSSQRLKRDIVPPSKTKPNGKGDNSSPLWKSLEANSIPLWPSAGTMDLG